MEAKLGIRLERSQRLRFSEYHNGNGDFHFHSQIEICYVTEGEVDVLVNDRKKRLKKGELSIALAYDTHRYLPVGDAWFCVLVVPPDVCREFETILGGRIIPVPFITEGEAAERIGACIREIKRCREQAKEDGALLMKGGLYLILGIIAQNVSFEAGAAPHAGSDLVSKILLYVHEHYREEISLSDVAAHFGYNASYISGLFKTSIGIGLLRYITLLRLKHAVTLLQQKNHGTEYCVEASGFRSVRTFYRAFRETFGCSPKEYLEKK